MNYMVGALQNAIKQQESGGDYSVTNGDSGAFGAYQFMPETWNDWATRGGFDPGDTSPANQDAVANYAISSLYAQYGDPRKVASVWYSGSPDYTVDSDEGDYPTVSRYVQQVMNRMGQGSFQYQGRDAQGNPFLNLNVKLRTNNPNEPFNAQAILGLLQSKAPELKENIKKQLNDGPDFAAMAQAQGPYISAQVQPVADTLMKNQLAVYADNAARQILQDNLQRGAEAIQLINSSNNVDNKAAYAGLMKQAGIDVPSNVDQYVLGPQLLKAYTQQIDADQKYNLAQTEWNDQKNISEQQLGMLQGQLDSLNRIANLYGQ